MTENHVEFFKSQSSSLGDSLLGVSLWWSQMARGKFWRCRRDGVPVAGLQGEGKAEKQSGQGEQNPTGIKSGSVGIQRQQPGTPKLQDLSEKD